MKQLIIDQIEVTQNGTIQIRMHKLSSDGDMIGNHRTAIEPGGDIDAQIAAVNAHMGSEGYAAIPDADVVRVKATAAATWTPENIAPVTAQVVEAIKEQQAAITEAAAKKAEAEAAAAQEIEDAKAREVAANEAKALAEQAEAASKAAQEAAAKAAADLEAENARVAAALAAKQAAEDAAKAKAAFDKAVADAVAAQLAPVEVV